MARTSRITPRPRARIGAFFDMDKTLIAENSGAIYFRHRYEQGEIEGKDLLLGLAAYLRYKVGLLDIGSFTREMAREFAGLKESEVASEAREVLHEKVVQTIYPEAAEIVRWHQAQRHVVVIVSGSTRYVVDPLARHLGVKHTLYTRFEVEKGRFTGRVVEPVCFEEGKIYWLQQIVEDQNLDLARSWFYTDSVTDLPLLELVGHPVVTNPDPRLYREAVRRRWPVRLFEPPEVGAEPALREASGPSPRMRSSDAPR